MERAMTEHPFNSLSRRAVLAGGTVAGAALALEATVPAWAQGTGNAPILKPIPKTGEKLPVIGVGTNAYGVSDPAEVAARREVLSRLPELGGKVVDTAQAYGTSEAVIGEQVAAIGNRAKLFLATKTANSGDFADPKAIVEKSFAALRTDKIDLLQVHSLAGLAQLMPVLLDYKKAGRVRYVGVSTSADNQYPALVEAMNTYPFDFIQVDYSIENRGAEEAILPLALAKKMAVLNNMPFGGRRATLISQAAGKPLPSWAGEIGVTSWPQFFLKYIVSHPAVTAAIPGTTKITHLEDNQKAGRGVLPDAAMRRRMEDYWASLKPAA
jgi:aryl-alcohol dehydrogenase-like predicted oxidoreductase